MTVMKSQKTPSNCLLRQRRSLALRTRCARCGIKVEKTVPGWLDWMLDLWSACGIFLIPWLWFRLHSFAAALALSILFGFFLFYVVQILGAGVKCGLKPADESSRGDRPPD